MSGASQAVSPIEDRGPPPGLAPIFGSHGSMSSITSTSSVGSMGTIPANIPVANDINTSDNHLLQRSDSQGKRKLQQSDRKHFKCACIISDGRELEA